MLVYTYGGPHAQVVMNAWGGGNSLWHQMMAQKGYIIFALDNRGSAGRGHLFRRADSLPPRARRNSPISATALNG